MPEAVGVVAGLAVAAQEVAALEDSAAAISEAGEPVAIGRQWTSGGRSGTETL